ncbi:hemerythrin domain-containing protein [Streptomyces sp. WAC05292]|uniref:hemerythrin domain-containing protein n=1 Tax=Streptomyces sp. WAC05292 TaxID=2487418 RepID=UPI000F73FA92|nr:hemerythrin domain-containing protein [Streptomyces sp. WAC05292]RSS82529.1 hemerythrin domain-containing protein [Streptomyces sp. WAC05292]
MGHGGDVVHELTADHDEVRGFFADLANATPAEERRTLLDLLTIELVRHSVAEEEYQYPAVRKHVPGGDAIADREIEDHARVEVVLKELEAVDAAGPEFDRMVGDLRNEVLEHIRDEETSLFPALRRACDKEVLDELGDRVRLAKKLAPTRPHPGKPSEPPANKLLAPGLGLVDRARDFVSGRGRTGS